MAEKNASPAPAGPGPVEDVGRIREIIFGPQMRTYDQRFEMLQRDIGRLQQALDRLSDQLSEQDASQSKKLQDLRREVRETDEALRTELRDTAQTLMVDKVDRVALGQLFTQLAASLASGGSLADLLTDLPPK